MYLFVLFEKEHKNILDKIVYYKALLLSAPKLLFFRGFLMFKPINWHQISSKGILDTALIFKVA